ncbi:hypothetical protein K469DRAFT_664325 [Zopfia rhizophila CBS 207.26]|uniref:Zn(2)-C6 fungal-type domain-containing protein n=1 Tax=Zopfia rhizophila CBS 207.26 TaxID=1314779 RepID=A0A6A6E5V8_9PEZI|nr:hypothetical protein K469DRAFT_664325 [Zopfia rhizophila CBS 207.26]
MRPAIACQQCRNAKRKCQRPEPGRSCVQCLRRQLQCSNSTSTSTKLRRDIPLAHLWTNANKNEVEDESCLVLSQQTIEELVEQYIYFIHDRPHSLFHQPTLRRDVRNKRMKKALLYSICGLGCRFSQAIEIRSLAPRLLTESKRLLQVDLDNVCLENIQACILVANLRAAESLSSSEALYFGIANRMAHIIGLTAVDSADSGVLRETKNRVWWTLFMADRWCSSGLGLPRQFNDFERPVNLPMDEYAFHHALEDQGSSTLLWIPGLWAHMVTLVEIFGPVQDLNRCLAQNAVDDETAERQVRDLAHRLESWEESLPASVKLNEDNLHGFQRSGFGGAFVALHLGYHHYATLLYFRYLDKQCVTATRSEAYAERCKYHAFAYSALLKRSREGRGCETVYPTVGYMALVSSAVLIHTLLFGDEHELTDARISLSANFEALVELKSYWPCIVKNMINRLYTFQNVCLRSTQSHTHKLTRWTVRFLLEHYLPSEEEVPEPAPLRMATKSANLSLEALRLSERGVMTNAVLSNLLL